MGLSAAPPISGYYVGCRRYLQPRLWDALNSSHSGSIPNAKTPEQTSDSLRNILFGAESRSMLAQAALGLFSVVLFVQSCFVRLGPFVNPTCHRHVNLNFLLAWAKSFPFRRELHGKGRWNACHLFQLPKMCYPVVRRRLNHARTSVPSIARLPCGRRRSRKSSI